MKKVLATLLIIIFSANSWAVIDTRVEPTQISKGESFRVIYSYQGDASNIVPDLSPLEREFTVLGTSKSSQVSIVNGRVKTSTQWVVSLMAKRVGELFIPRVNFGQQLSREVKIQITPNASRPNLSKSNAQKEVLLKTSVDTKTPYLHAQVIYTERLYYASSLGKAELEPPQADNMIIRRIGKNKTYQSNYRGTLYQVVERKYAMFGQKSGPIKIKPPIFKGIIRRTNMNRIYDLLNDYQEPIQLTGDEITLKVKPQPTSYTGKHWIPAKKLTLSEQWEGLERVKVGNPITRTLTITATGLTANQIPKINFSDSPGVNTYPEKPQASNRVTANNVEGTKIIRITYLPSREGQINLDPVHLTWWDTRENREKKASLSGKTITVGKVQSQANQVDTVEVKQPSVDSGKKESKKNTFPIEKVELTKVKKSLAPSWIIVIFLAMAWIATLLFLYFSRKKTKTTVETLPTNSLGEVKKRLKKACMNDDAKACRNALIEWGNQQWPQRKIYNLASLSEIITDSNFKQQLNLLQKKLYAQTCEPWQGSVMWQAWLDLKQIRRQKKRQSVLPPINL